MNSNTRSIALDTETTGLSTKKDRIVEIGCVEMINDVRTGKVFHQYINPQRSMPEIARGIHGLSEEFLKDKPLFRDIYKDFLDFIGNDILVIHNSSFDLRFLNFELNKIGVGILKNEIYDTLKIARKLYPKKRLALDNLCKMFKIDNSKRSLHGALLDADLLAQVYYNFPKEGDSLELADTNEDKEKYIENIRVIKEGGLFVKATENELKAHDEFLRTNSL